MPEASVDPRAFVEAGASDMRALADVLSRAGSADSTERNAGEPLRSGQGAPAAFATSLRETLPIAAPEEFERPANELERVRTDLNVLWRAVMAGGETDPTQSHGVPSDPSAFKAPRDGGTYGAAHSLVHLVFGRPDDFVVPPYSITNCQTRSLYNQIFGASNTAYLDPMGPSIASDVLELKTKVAALEEAVANIQTRLTAAGI